MVISVTQLKSLRVTKGLTQAELANNCGLSQSLIARIENGTVDPRFSTMQKISEALQQKLLARSFMSHPVIFATSNYSLVDAIKDMKKFNISQMPVMEKGKQIGSLVDSEILKRTDLVHPASLESQDVLSVMGDPFPYVEEEDELELVIKLLQDNAAVVVTSKNAISGIITRADVLGVVV